MTDCTDMKDKLGPYVDNELSSVEADRIRTHLAECDRCREEVVSLRDLAAAIAREPAPDAPPGLWLAIEQAISKEAAPAGRPAYRRLWFRPWRVAAALAIAAGIGAFLLPLRITEKAAQASTIDFGVILDALALDPQEAFSRFLTRYHGVELGPGQAHSFAPDLDFDVPAVLPGGFQRRAVYALRFGPHPGIAARYDRSGEFLATVFHPPVHPRQFGTHQDYPCVIGNHHGREIAVGEWRLVHITDRTTCHCILSRLNGTELRSVVAAVVPTIGSAGPSSQDAGH